MPLKQKLYHKNVKNCTLNNNILKCAVTTKICTNKSMPEFLNSSECYKYITHELIKYSQKGCICIFLDSLVINMKLVNINR